MEKTLTELVIKIKKFIKNEKILLTYGDGLSNINLTIGKISLKK